MSHTLHIFGKVMADPELRYSPTGKAVVNLRVGDSRKVKDAEGNAQWENTYFTVTCWEKTAEFVNNHIHKGDYVAASGVLQPTIRIWEGTDGQSRANYEMVRVHNIEKAWNTPSADTPDVEEDDEDRIPF